MFGVLRKISRLTFETSKMANIENGLERLDVIHEIIPIEIFVMILKKTWLQRPWKCKIDLQKMEKSH